MIEQHIEKAAEEYAEPTRAYLLGEETRLIKEAFVAGASYVLQHQWVSVEERLPEDDYDVIACIKEREDHTLYCEIAYHFKGEWRTTNGEYIHPTHWFPIPKLNNEKD